MLFPFLFVTIACGACSGFHGLVCSGTTSKQIDKESHTHPVGYGAMLAEGFVAFIALVTVMIASKETLFAPDGKMLSAGKIYGNGIGNFLTILIGKEHLQFAITFGAMAFSTFVFDTLDVCMRLGRYIVQELFGIPGRVGAVIGTLATVARDGTSLDLEAVRSIARWRYEPARVDGSSVPVLLAVRLTWTLSSFPMPSNPSMRR